MNVPLDEVIYFDAITTTPSTGAAVDADSTPTFAVYEEATDTDIGVGGNLTKRTSLTGNYRGSFTLSAANGFEVGKWYSIIGSAVVGGVTGKAVLKNFRVVAAEAIAGKPKADVDALLGTAWLTPGTAGTPDVNTKLVGGTAQTGGDLKTLIDAVDNFVDTEMADVQARLPAALTAGGNMKCDALAISGDTVAADNAESFFDGTGYAGTNNVIPTVTLCQTLTTYTGNTPQTGDAYTYLGTNMGALGANLTAADDAVMSRLGAPAGASVSADVAAMKAETALIVADTNELQADWANGGRLDLILDARASQTSVDAVDDFIDTEIAAIQSTLASLLTTAMTEAYRTDGATGSVAQLLYELTAHHGETSIVSTTKTIKKIDGSTTAATFTLDSATTPTSITRAS